MASELKQLKYTRRECTFIVWRLQQMNAPLSVIEPFARLVIALDDEILFIGL